VSPFVKGIYGVDPVRISTNVSLDPTDTKAGHIRLRLDQGYQDTLALKADTEAALALKASSVSLAALQSSVALDLQTKADQTSLDALSGFVSQLEPGFVAQAPLAKGFEGIPSYDADLGANANAADTYTKAQVDSSLALKASVASVVDGLSIKADQNSVDALSALVSTLQPAASHCSRCRSMGTSHKWTGPPCRWAISGFAQRATPCSWSGSMTMGHWFRTRGKTLLPSDGTRISMRAAWPCSLSA
jgi:hypothetical protein